MERRRSETAEGVGHERICGSINKMYSNDKNFYSVEDIEPLAQKILLVGLMENLEVVRDPCDRGEYRIIAGERRWRALKILVEKGYTEFEKATCQIQTPASEEEETLRLIIANDYRNKTVSDLLEVKEIKQQQEEKAAAEQIEGQMNIDQFTEAEEEIEEPEDDAEDTEEEDEWEDAHPESITSLCYSCKRYSDCNVKTGTCQSCDQYINKAEAEKTEEERYSEEQDAIDRETAKKLREKADEEKMQQLPSQQEKKVHDVKLGTTFFDDVKTGRKTFELRKNDSGYKEGDIIVMHEYKDGTTTGRTIEKKIVYMLEDFTGLEDGYCILGLGEVKAGEE